MPNPFDNQNPNQITAITDLIGRRPHIVQLIQACNEEQWIKSCMLQLYDKVDRIIVIEGAVQNRPNTTPDGHSCDKTVEVIRETIKNHDPEDKIIFCQIDRPFKDLEEMKNTFFNYMNEGQWALITDCDEFIHPEVVDRLRRAIQLEPWATEFVPDGFFHFWRDFWHLKRPNGDWGQQHQRFIKYQPGLHYRTHPVATDKDGQCTYFSPHYLPRRFVLPGFTYYHYSYAKASDAEIKLKKEFYDKELGQAKHGHVGAYARGGQTEEYLNPDKADRKTLLRFDGDHPPIMKDHQLFMRRDPFFNEKDGDLQHYKEVEPYSLKPHEMGLIWVWQNLEKKMAFFTNFVEAIEETKS